MSVYKLVRLNFKNHPVHFGELGIGMEETSERVHSDTLFSAWMSAYARCWGKDAIDDLITQFVEHPNRPPFRLSSTFIYRAVGQNQDESFTYYLPKLMCRPRRFPDATPTLRKTLKKLCYVPLEVWQQWYQGTGFNFAGQQELEEQTKTYSETFKTQRIPKISVDRVSQAANLYYTGFARFEYEKLQSPAKRSGLYFLIEFVEIDDSKQSKLLAALCFLGEEGIGGERSSGAGRFELDGDNFLELPSLWQQVITFEGNFYSLISLLWDDSEQLEASLAHESSAYVLQERGGWIGSPFSGVQRRRKLVRMFTEGSLFPEKLHGRLADVTPSNRNGLPHDIYRSGIGFYLPILIEF